jgi:ribosome recycling factor
MAIISPYDKGSLGVIERAIRDSDLGVNPTNDGTSSGSSSPQLTEERRREVHQGRPRQGRGRQDLDPQHPSQGDGGAGPLAKDGEVGEDEVARAEKELEKTTAQYVSGVDELLKHKEAELLEV